MQRSSSLAASLPSGIGTPPSATSRSGCLPTYSAMPSLSDARGLHARCRAARCNRSAAAPGEMSCMSTPMSSMTRSRASVLRMRSPMSAACLAMSALVSAFEKWSSGTVDVSRCGAAISPARGNRDMGVHVDGEALRPRLAPRLAALARRRRFVLVPHVRHCLMSSLLKTQKHAEMLAQIDAVAVELGRRPRPPRPVRC